jgi:hypothetical protein
VSLVLIAVALLEPLWQMPDQAGTEVQPPPGYAPVAPLAFVVLLVGAWLFLRVRRARRRGYAGGLRSMPGGSGVGNALLDFSAMLQPDRPVAELVQQLEEHVEHDEVGDGRDQGARSGGSAREDP